MSIPHDKYDVVMTNWACDPYAVLTPRDVVDRLKAVYGEDKLDRLEAKSGIPLRLLQRWSELKPKPQIESHLRLLDKAGLLLHPDAPIPDRVHDERVIQTARRLAEEAEELVRLLDRETPAATSGGGVP